LCSAQSFIFFKSETALQLMPKATLTLRSHRKNTKGQCSIFVRYSHKDASCFFACGVMIDPKFWDPRTETIRKSCPSYSSLNSILTKLKSEIDEIKLKLQLQDIEPTVDAVRTIYQKKSSVLSQKDPIPNEKYLLDYYDDFTAYQRDIKNLAPGTLTQYYGTRRLMAEFQEYAGKQFLISDISRQWVEQLLFYILNVKGCASNTAGSRLKMIRSYGNWLLANSLLKDVSFRLVKKPTNKTDIVTLSVEQINYLFSLDLSHSRRLEAVRDLYCLNSNLGLRFSDLHGLTPANFKDGFMVVRTRKTDNVVRVPLNPMARLILEKYDYKLPKISNVKFNKYIKEVGEVAKFDSLHEVHTFKRGVKERHLVPLKDLMTSHQCRRNFCTNCLRLGLSPSLTQKLSGHSSYAVFAKYISVADEYLASEFNKVWEGAYPKTEENHSKTG